MNNIQEYNSINIEPYLEDIKSIVIDCKVPLEGNCFYYHHTLKRFGELFNKQVNLFSCGINAKRVCEIGFNAGHSALLMLLSKTITDFTIFDIGLHKYTKPTFDYIVSKFPNVKFEYVIGDSTIEMPLWINKNSHLCGQYDVVHIDGGHSEYCITNDIKNSLKLVKIGGILVIDDTHDKCINRNVDLCLESGKFQELNILPTQGYVHRILKRV